MKPSTSLFVVGVFLAQLAAAGPASAQSAGDRPDSSEAQAHEHFSLGVKLYADGDFGPALAQFQRAYTLKPHVKVLYNIAQCYFELRDYVQARAALERYLAEDGAPALDVERRARLEADLADLGRRVAQLDVVSNVPGAVVYVDGRRVGTTPLSSAIEVSEGSRSLSVESQQQGTKQRSILLVGGERQTVTVDFEDIHPAPSESSGPHARRAPAFPPPAPASHLGAGFWLASVGAVALGSGAGVTGYLALQAQNERHADLGRLGVSAAELNADGTRIRTLAVASDSLLGGAILCAGIATTLFLVRDTENSPAVAVGPGHVAVLGSF